MALGIRVPQDAGYGCIYTRDMAFEVKGWSGWIKKLLCHQFIHVKMFVEFSPHFLLPSFVRLYFIFFITDAMESATAGRLG
jgi:hypothetical protein